MTHALKAAEVAVNDDVETVARHFLERGGPTRLNVPGAHMGLVHYTALGLGDWLCRTPKDEQPRWTIHVPRDPTWNEPDDGAIFRDDERGSDQKVFFHVREDIEENLAANGAVLDELCRSWIRDCNRLREKCVGTLKRLTATIDRLSPGMRLVQRLHDAEMSDHSSVLRVLSYETGEAGFAKEHYDRNGFSFQLGASDNGLYFRTGDEKRYPGAPRDEEAIAFTGTQLAKVSGGKIAPVLHGTDPATGPCRRWSVVFFGYLAP